MKRATGWLGLVVVVVVLLVVTGVVDENLLLGALVAAFDDRAAEAVTAGAEAFFRGDLKAIAALGGPWVRPVAWAYLVRALVCVGGGVLLIVWARPLLQRAFEMLRRIDPLDVAAAPPDLAAAGTRASVVQALRGRASRKRVESYAFLGAALASLAIAIGFVTRDPIGWDGRGPEDPAQAASMTFDKADMLLTRSDTAEMLRPPGEAPRAHDATPELVKEYIGFARAQLEDGGRQAERDAWRSTTLAVVTKLAAVVLILALARVLVRLYQRGLGLSVQYEAIADAVLLGHFDPAADPVVLRELFTPRDATVETDLKPSKELIGLIDRAIAALAPLRGGK